MRRATDLAALLVAALLALALFALAAPAGADDWSARKCALYARAWQHATAGDGLAGIGPAFVADHDTFLAAGCQAGAVCPTNDPERALADRLALMAIGEGMTGSFLPFACPD